MERLKNWLVVDQRRTSVICRAKYNGVWQWCVILRDPYRDPAMCGLKSILVGAAYHHDLEQAIDAALRSF